MNNMDLTQLLEKIYQKLTTEVTNAYYNGDLDELLKKYGIEDETEHFYYDTNHSKIIVIGDTMINKNEMEYIAKQNGINPKRMEFVLEYDKITNYNFEKFKYNMSYSDILVGPIPHKVNGLDDSSSFLSMARKHPDIFPKVIELRDSNKLKITKSSFQKGLLETRFYNEI